MARIRTIKPDFWSDGTMVQLSAWARLFYIGTWTFSLCDQGHLADDAVGLKLKILPADDIDAHDLLNELLVAGRLVRRRSSNGRSYLFNPRLAEHQKTDGRWVPRCPYCVSEKDGGYTQDASPEPAEPHRASPEPAEPHRASPEPAEPHRASPEPAEPHRNTSPESKGREGKVKEQNATRSAEPAEPHRNSAEPHRAPAGASAAAGAPTALSITQRSKRITDAYAEAQPLCKWPAINGIVITAIKAGRWSDDEIRDALLRLASEGRPVTVETLRVELAGLPPRRASPKPSTTDQRVGDALALATQLELESREVAA